jgi:hypothetical protein
MRSTAKNKAAHFVTEPIPLKINNKKLRNITVAVTYVVILICGTAAMPLSASAAQPAGVAEFREICTHRQSLQIHNLPT